MSAQVLAHGGPERWGTMILEAGGWCGRFGLGRDGVGGQ